jgi:hypothetical protein
MNTKKWNTKRKKGRRGGLGRGRRRLAADTGSIVPFFTSLLINRLYYGG